MNTKNLIVGGIVGGVVYFLLGWLFYGNLLHDYFKENPGTATNVNRTMEEMVWWALIAGNLLFGFLLSYVFSKSGVASISSGMVTGGIIGLLACSGVDLVMYATTNIDSKRAIAADIATFTVMSAITGAVVGAVLGMLNRKTVTTDV